LLCIYKFFFTFKTSITKEYSSTKIVIARPQND
jgi:hypothetical protein